MNLGIIAGSGDLPVYIANLNKEAFVLCVDQQSNPDLYNNKSIVISLLNPIEIIKILKDNDITHVVMAGKISRPNKDYIKRDDLNDELVSKLNFFGDNEVLNFIEKFFIDNGIKIIPIFSVINNCFIKKGFYPIKIKNHIKNHIIKTAEFGVELLNTVSKYDIGQSVVVNSNLVYAIEGMEGTDSMIERAGHLYNKTNSNIQLSPILVKIPKINQNINLDLPVIGPNTINKCIKFGFISLVVSSKGTIIFDIKTIKKILEKNVFYIYSI
ncbi:UDP-2,3-diacylglucosamine diphosphatase LpxI [bacterium]|nr:UDP-2,3-diacylglucosamine diphosphatase LpxI [bacterium]